jgi:biopolymer transport protein ExbB/TolQ
MRETVLARSRTPWGSLIVGTVAGAAVLAAIHFGPFQGTIAQRYVSHPVECVEVIMFTCAAATLASKFRQSRREHRALRSELMPAWDGVPVPIAEASILATQLNQAPAQFRSTFLVRRLEAVLGFVSRRGSIDQLDEHLRALSDNDAVQLEASYSLTRFITWAIPILGFLGTVLGITEAIAGVTPEVLEQSLSSVTDGLALAFDSTALGLGLTMIAMFMNFLVDRAEGSALEAVDHYVDRHFAHRFERPVEAEKPLSAFGREVLEPIVRRQADIWAQTLAEVDRRRQEIETGLEKRLTAALEQALQRTHEAYAVRMEELEKQAVDIGATAVERLAEQARGVCEAGKEQQHALAKLVHGVAAQVQVLGRLQAGEEQLLRLQETLDRNLSVVAVAGSLDKAVHSLTAAIHLLTTRTEDSRPRTAA